MSLFAESKLPEGDPASRGVSLDPGIPGTSTFAKPSGEPPRGQGVEDSSIYRVDDADSLLKSQTTPDSTDLQNLRPSYATPGPNDGSITKYPYRDGVPNAHNAMEREQRVVVRVVRRFLGRRLT